MAQNVYECLLILDSNQYARDPNAASEKVAKLIESCEGKTLVSRLWNEQKLAYPINGQRKGAYWLCYFELEPGKVDDFNRQCSLSDFVIRSMTLKVDPRLVDALVSHAKGETPDPEESAPEEAPASEKAASEESPVEVAAVGDVVAEDAKSAEA